MDIIISFDIEDFITPRALEAQLFWPTMLSRNNVRGSFQIVAELVRKWQRERRQDIIDAVAQHEIAYHTNYHSLHPEHPEGVEDLNLADGLEWIRQREASGLECVRDCFGVNPIAYTPSGDSWTPAMLLHMAEEGIKVATDVGFVANNWYCGMLMKSYDLCLDTYMNELGDPEAISDQIIEKINAMKNNGQSTITIYSHPCRLVTDDFWDGPLYDGKDLPPEEITPPPLRSEEQIEQNKAMVELVIQKINKDPEWNWIDCAQHYEKHAANKRDAAALLEETGVASLGELPLKEAGDESQYVGRRFKRGWPLYEKSFTGEKVIDQGRRLLWTVQGL